MRQAIVWMIGGVAALLWLLALDTWRPGVLPVGLLAVLCAIPVSIGVALAIGDALNPRPRPPLRGPARLGIVFASGAALLALFGFAALIRRHRTPSPVQFVRLREQMPYGHGELARAADGAVLYTTVHGIEVAVERSQFDLDVLPNARQLQAANALVDAVRASARRFADYDSVQAQGGFRVNATVLGDDEGSEMEHLINPEYLRDSAYVDAARPEALVFRRSGTARPELVGIMFMMPRGMHGPQLGGPLTKWHYHPETFFCMDSIGTPSAKRGGDGSCPDGMNSGPSSEMMHVWLVNNTYGVFAHMMDGAHLAHDMSPGAPAMDHSGHGMTHASDEPPPRESGAGQ